MNMRPFTNPTPSSTSCSSASSMSRPNSSGRAWTTPEHLKKWFTPAPWTTVDCEIDLRPGGIFRTVMRSPEGQEFPNVGCSRSRQEREADLDQCAGAGLSVRRGSRP